MNGIKETCEMLDQARTEVLAGAPSSAISLRSLSGFHHAHTIDTTPSSLYILPKKPAKFYARAEEIERLQRGLHEYHSICISGTGGVGKTSLALHFAYRSFSHYRFMFHIRSDSELSINQDFTKIAMKLGLPGVNKEQYMANRELVLDWLQSTSEAPIETGSSLFVLDRDRFLETWVNGF
jgi:predicted ATP-dependent serine protease